MGKGSRTKGFAYEREVVSQSRNSGIESKRFWGSDGRSAGYDEEVDGLVGPYTAQCARRRKLPALLKKKGGTDLLIMRGDNETSLVVISLPDFLALMKEAGLCYFAVKKPKVEDSAMSAEKKSRKGKSSLPSTLTGATSPSETTAA